MVIGEFKIVREIGVVDTSDRTAWTKELNVIDWGGGPVYDLRAWAPEHFKAGKGITLDKAGLMELRRLIDEALGEEGGYGVQKE